MYHAHSTPDPSKRDWQPLRDHLVAVAALAERFGQPLGIARAAELAGLLHDLGKYTAEFQARLSGVGGPTDHSTAGAHHVRMLGRGDDRVICELIAFAIAGHHAGLPDKVAPSGSLADRLQDFSDARLDPVWREEIRPEAQALMPAFDFGDALSAPFRLGLLGRMIFSCLVDADYRDTEAFYDKIEGRDRDRAWPALPDVLPDLTTAFDRHMAGLAKADGPINGLRRDILAHVRAHAADSQGLFTLTVPTGGGKTLASLGFALDHAKEHGLRRIIYAIPFTSIIDQTVDIFRHVLGDDVVLEHHSAIEEDGCKGYEAGEKLKLAMEDWAAPVVVTTNVQLFESLFAARPSRCRKLHNIAGSVIILDEAQTLPRHLLAPCAQMLAELARNYRCSIVLCTATQPALDAGNFPEGHPVGLPLAGRELAPDPKRLAVQLRRATIRRGPAMDNDRLVEALGRTRQGLVIVNSRRHAADLYAAGREAGLDGLIHLTTRQYAAHRREILAEIRRRLPSGHPCRVVATSLVEAGVDLDFPVVWRAETGLDQIAQAAGRCNREGRRPPESSIVTVFSAPDYPPPSEIKALRDDLARVADKHPDLLSPAAMDDYFGEVYWRWGSALDREGILKLFALDRTGPNFSYRTAAERFRMIESSLVPVIVAREDRAKRLVEKLSVDAVSSGTLAQALQSFVVPIPRKARDLMIANGHVRFEAERLRADQFAVLQTGSLYSDEIGMFWENGDFIAIESSII